MSSWLGELAGIGTATSWSVSNQIHSAISRTTGATGLVTVRFPFFICTMGCMCLLAGADTTLGLEAFGYLALSGILGMGLCDWALYRGILITGPALGILVLSLSSVFTAIMGALFLGQSLNVQAVAGMLVILLGIGWVSTDGGDSILMPGQLVPHGKKLVEGFLWLILAAMGLATGFIFLKQALSLGTAPLWAAFIRIIPVALLFWGLGLANGEAKAAITHLRQNRKFLLLLPFANIFSSIGLWLSCEAVARIPTGVAATLIGLQPIGVTILGAIWYRKRPSLRAFSGIVIAFVGTALVCLR